MATKAQVKWGGRSWHLVPCDGNAHSPEVGGMQDHCGICAPFWARVCVPVGCETVGDWRAEREEMAPEASKVARMHQRTAARRMWHVLHETRTGAREE